MASVIVKLLGLDVPERPAYFGKLLGQISGLRATTGRPHWLILDEAHHLSPSTQDVQHNALPNEISSAVFITTNPRHLSPSALGAVRTVITVGPSAPQLLEDFCTTVLQDRAAADAARARGRHGAGVGSVHRGAAPAGDRRQSQASLSAKPSGCISGTPENMPREQLGEDKSFYFRGAAGALKLRAFNLATFLQLAQGVDDDTWLFH